MRLRSPPFPNDPDVPLSWVEPFTYGNGTLAGNGLWTLISGLGDIDVVSNRAVIEQTFQCGAENPCNGLPFDMSLPWSLEVVTNHSLSGGSTADVIVQFDAGGGNFVGVRWEATNSTADVEIFDASGTPNVLGNFSTAGNVTWRLIWDGSDLIVLRAGVEIGRTVGANITGITPLCQIGGVVSDDLKPWRFDSLRVDHPPL